VHLKKADRLGSWSVEGGRQGESGGKRVVWAENKVIVPVVEEGVERDLFEAGRSPF
jgi:hypothetical protein